MFLSEARAILTRYGRSTWLPLCLALSAAVAAAAIWAPWAPWPALLPGALLAFTLWFFRDPERRAEAPDGLLCPADGKIVEIAEVDEPEFLRGRARKISIFMSVVDVHVNRAPCDARVEWVRPMAGTFMNAIRAHAGLENERTLIALRRPDGTGLLMKQVAGLIARRIVCPLQAGAEVRRGERFGMIKFGSRVELFLPAEKPFEVRVRMGQKVAAGRTVLGVWK